MRNLHIWVVVLILFSYPVLTVWLTLGGFETSVYNLSLKGGIVAMAILGLLIYRPTSQSSLGAMGPLLAFFFLFGLRLIYDVMVVGVIDVFQSPVYVFGYFFGLTFIPAILLTIRLVPSDLPTLHRGIVLGLVIANFSLLVFSATRDLTVESAFAGRVQEAGDEAGTAVLGPIMVGAMGAILAAYAMGRVATDRLSLPAQVYHGVLLLLGLGNILFSGSRGPAVAFGAAFLVVVLTLVSSPFREPENRATGAGWLYAALAVIALTALLALTTQDIFLFDRFAMMYTGEISAGAEERNFIYAQAWQDFLSSPIIGRSYIVSVGGYSAHNFVLEALMATGVVGGMLFVLAVYRALTGTVRLLLGDAGPKGYSLALVMICMLVVASTSGSVRETPELWVMASIMTIFGAQAALSRQSAKGLRMSHV